MASGDHFSDVIVDTVETVDATIDTVCSYTIADEHVALLFASVTGQDTSVAANAYSFRGLWVANARSSLAYIRATGGNPNIADPAGTGWTVTMDSTADTVRVRVTGAVGDTVRWTCKLEVWDVERTAP